MIATWKRKATLPVDRDAWRKGIVTRWLYLKLRWALRRWGYKPDDSADAPPGEWDIFFLWDPETGAHHGVSIVVPEFRKVEITVIENHPAFGDVVGAAVNAFLVGLLLGGVAAGAITGTSSTAADGPRSWPGSRRNWNAERKLVRARGTFLVVVRADCLTT